MRKSLPMVAGALAIFLAGYGYGRWFRKDPLPVIAATGARSVLYYQCPMHPSVHLDRPGASPCCNMALIPVYAAAREPAFADARTALPAGAVEVSAEQRRTIGITTALAESGTVVETIRAAARVGLNENRVAHVQTKLDGWVDQVFVTGVGAEVKKGQTLLTVYHPKSMAAQQEFIEAMAAAGITAANADESARASRPANVEGLLAASKLRLQLLGFSDAQMETIMKTHAPMWKLPVLAPISGVVLERNALPRQKIVPDTLFTIADLTNVWVTADVLAPGAAGVVPGQRVTLTAPALPGKVFRGEIDAILPSLDPATHALKLRAQFDNPERLLRPEMYGDLEIRSTAALGRAVTVPSGAVLDRGLRQAVFVDKGEGYLEPREVTVGRRFGARVEILRGLKRGERVVASGHFLIDSESRLAAASKGPDDRAGH